MTVNASNSVVNVTNTKTTLLVGNPLRTGFVITNTDTAGGLVVSLAKGTTPVAGSGLVLYPGESYSESNSDGYPVYTGEVGAITTAAGPAAVAVSESFVVR
jgi:hypothetical protein